MLKFPKLHKRVLEHELEHIKTGKGLLLDLKEKQFDLEIFKFCLTHPRAFYHFFPIIIVDNYISYSWIMLILFLSFIFFIITFIKLLILI